MQLSSHTFHKTRVLSTATPATSTHHARRTRTRMQLSSHIVHKTRVLSTATPACHATPHAGLGCNFRPTLSIRHVSYRQRHPSPTTTHHAPGLGCNFRPTLSTKHVFCRRPPQPVTHHAPRTRTRMQLSSHTFHKTRVYVGGHAPGRLPFPLSSIQQSINPPIHQSIPRPPAIPQPSFLPKLLRKHVFS